MDEMTPALTLFSKDMTQCDGTEITKNLFKDHKPSLSNEKVERLHTYLRIRALNNSETAGLKSKCFQPIDSTTLVVIPPKGSNAYKNGSDSRKKFTFSRIFDEKSSQSDIYDNCALPIVKKFLSGENGLLFAYGITSSGKSYTMRGTTDNPGVIPHALNTIFDVIGHKIVKEVPDLMPNKFTELVTLSKSEKESEENLRKFIFENAEKYANNSLESFRSQISLINEKTSNENFWNDVLHSTFRSDNSSVKCSVWITYCEIYNEYIYDLLDVEISGEKKPKIHLLRDDFQNYYIKGLRHVCVSSAEEAYKVMLYGQNNLHISSTDLNKKSSRSHCAFNITLISTNAIPGATTTAVNNLSFCDLAGAERSEKANNTRDRIKEAGKINGSLLSLSRCLTAIRYNQKFEHDKNKQRLVNFNDSKLTKVLQPFLSGNGIASMISNMNPTPNLFDETLFALKFTGVASQIIVSTEEQRSKFHDSLKRLTQVWMQSSQRWSNFAHLNPSKPSFSIIQHQTIEEEEEDIEDENDLTYEELEKKVNEISRMDLSRAEPQEIEILRTQIDFLAEKLKQSESDKFDMELQVRKQVVSEFNKLIKDMEEMAEDKDKAKKKLEEMMSDRLKTADNIYKEERIKYEKRINDIENELFKDKEELCKENEKNKQLIEEINVLKMSQHKWQTEIDELKSLLSQKETQINCLDLQLKEQNQIQTITNQKQFIDANTSNSSLIEFDSKQTSISIECEEKATATSFTEHIDCETTTDNLNKQCDKSTSFSKLFDNKSTSIERIYLNVFEDKETITECLSPVEMKNTIKLDKSILTNELMMTEMSTSPFVVNTANKCTSPSTNMKDNYISKEEFESFKTKFEAELKSKYETELKNKYEAELKNKYETELKNKYETELKNKYETELKSKYETELRQKDAMIAFNREIVDQRDQELLRLKEENEKLLNNKKDIRKEPDLEQLYKSCKLLKTSSIASSIASVNSMSHKSEDTSSMTSAASLALKEKQNLKSSKYSSRKKNRNLDNSMERRYLFAVKETIDTKCETLSQSSVNSDNAESTQDEIGNVAYSTTKKKGERKANKRKVHNSSNNEDFNKAPESKRKRPPIKNLSISPISPIPSDEVKRITRSRAQKAIKF